MNAWHEVRNATAWTSGLLPPDVADVRNAAPAAVLAASAEAHGWSWAVVRLGAAGRATGASGGKAALMEAFATGLELPAYFGRNWDALWDCLTDDTLLPDPGRRMIVIDQWRPFADRNPRDWDRTRDVLRDAVEYWGETGTPMGVLLRW